MDESEKKAPAGETGDKIPRRAPRPSEWANVMDELFEQAVREGAFDNLPGKGKPLKLSNNPLGSEYELAYQLLKDNDYTLPWIAERSEIERRTTALRQALRRTWERFQAEYQAAVGEAIQMSLVAGWRDQLARWREEIRELNKMIADANLKQPGDHMEIFKLSLERELARIGARETLD